MKKNILITGGAGFIGSHLCERLLREGAWNVSVVDDLNDFYPPEIKRANLAEVRSHGDINFYEADIRRPDALRPAFEENEFHAIVHLAARAGVRPSLTEPKLYTETNINGTMNLLELAREYGVGQFVFGSSSSVYGVNEKVPFSENDPIFNPISPYAATKAAGELICHTYSHLFGIRTVCLRFFTVYGARQRPDLAIHKFSKLISDGRPIQMFGDGRTRRDYTYIDDIIQGTMAAFNYDGPLYDVFNLGESQTIQLKDLILAIENAVGKKAKINRLAEQPGDMPRTYADISKARKLLGYSPTTKLSEGLPKFVEWFLQSQSG